MCEWARLLSQLWHERRATSCHVIFLNLLLKFFLRLFLNICVQDKDHDNFDPGSHSDELSLPRNWYRRERYVLGIIQGQDHDNLGVVIGQIKTNSTPCGPSFVDPTLSLIISFLDSQASLVLTTPNTCASIQQALRTSRVSLRLACWPSTVAEWPWRRRSLYQNTVASSKVSEVGSIVLLCRFVSKMFLEYYFLFLFVLFLCRMNNILSWTPRF